MSDKLCQTCQGITVESLQNGSFCTPAIPELTRRKDSCRLCNIVHEALDGSEDTVSGNDDRVYLSGTVSHVSGPNSEGYRTSRFELGNVYMRRGPDSIPLHQRPCGMLRVFATQGCSSQVRAAIPRRPIITPDAEEAVARCHEWLTRCLNDHKQCRRGLSGLKYNDTQAPQSLPARVIDVSNTPRLTITRDEKANYVTLSYCWGAAHRQSSKPEFLLTKESLKTFLKSLPLDKLPRTIRDAITVTKKLGYRYLWVDSLCIVQDSEEDWIEQSQKMGQIFQDATFTIAATAAADSSEGLFRREFADIAVQDDGSRRENFIKIPCILQGRLLGDMCVVRLKRDLHQLPSELQESTWNFRAWIVQEKLLSRRILHYGRTQLFYECQEREWTESVSIDNDELDEGARLRPEAKQPVWDRISRESTLSRHWASSSETLRTVQTRAMVAYDKFRFKLGLFDSNVVDDARFRFWTRVIWLYNVTHLTRESDKLVAILGLGKMLQSRLRMTYCAGAWIEEIACGLYWWAEDPDPSEYVQELDPVYGSEAPTWSWAAWRGPIAFASFMTYLENARPRVNSFCDKTQVRGAARSFLNISAHAWPGRLRTMGPTSTEPHHLTEWTVKWEPEITTEPFVLFSPGADNGYEIEWDLPSLSKAEIHGLAQCDGYIYDLEDGFECMCLVMSSTLIYHEKKPRAYGYHVLLVRASEEEPGAYSRVGIGVCSSSIDCLPSNWLGRVAPNREFLLI